MTNKYACNMCGDIMSFEQRKYIFVEVAGDGTAEQLGIHICPTCKPEVVGWVNRYQEQLIENSPKQKRNRFGKFTK